MKSFLSILLLVFSFTRLLSQPTNKILITGEIEKDSEINPLDISNFKEKKIGDIDIINHLGEKRKTLKNVKGVLIKDILKNKIQFKVENGKFLSEFYLIFITSDNYKAVFSWNEIFDNSIVGNSIYIITEIENKKPENFSVVVTSDDTSRRYIKDFERISINRVQ